MGLSPTPFSVKRKLLFVFRILDALEIALSQSETLLLRRHVRILINVSPSTHNKSKVFLKSYYKNFCVKWKKHIEAENYLKIFW